jgi:hypothetical protein
VEVDGSDEAVREEFLGILERTKSPEGEMIRKNVKAMSEKMWLEWTMANKDTVEAFVVDEA